MKLIFNFFLCFLIKVYTKKNKGDKQNFLRKSKSVVNTRSRCKICYVEDSCTHLCANHQVKSNACRLIDILDQLSRGEDDIVIKFVFPGQISWHDGNACHAVITALRQNPLKVTIRMIVIDIIKFRQLLLFNKFIV